VVRGELVFGEKPTLIRNPRGKLRISFLKLWNAAISVLGFEVLEFF
jgi:hypothetical protein